VITFSRKSFPKVRSFVCGGVSTPRGALDRGGHGRYNYSTSPVAEKSMPTLRRIMSRVAIILSDASSVR
jgi:hypothetical protein